MLILVKQGLALHSKYHSPGGTGCGGAPVRRVNQVGGPGLLVGVGVKVGVPGGDSVGVSVGVRVGCPVTVGTGCGGDLTCEEVLQALAAAEILR
jgi:hypothetical protein